jgi:choline dehydrogenase
MTWDYIIAGGGTAGCVLANRLTADGKSSVLLLEAGGSDRTPFVRIPAGEIYAIASPRYNWNYDAEPDPSLDDRVTKWPGGKVLGGSSSINGMIYLRGQREDYDDWASLLGGTDLWSYSDVLPYFKRMESNEFGAGEYHGDAGPLCASHVSTPHPLAKAFIEAGVEIGIPHNPDLNGQRQEGIGPLQGSIRRGRRHNTGLAYLRPARRRSNLTVITHATVDRILFDGSRAIGVRFAKRGKIREERASGEVILSAGALASPTVLMRSGLGPEEHLSQHGISVLHHLPGVGKNLQENPIAFPAAFVNVSTHNTEVSPYHFVKHGLNWLLFGRGPASGPVAHAAAFIRTRPDDESRPDVQLQFFPVIYASEPGTPVKLLERPGVLIGVNACRPQSCSEIWLRSPNPDDPPCIRSNLFSDPDDMVRTIAGCRVVREIFATRAFAPYFEQEVFPGPGVQSDAEFEQYLRIGTLPAYHPVGTCKMGLGSDAVVDERLRVLGVERLRVVDASVMPVIPSANTNAPTIMVAERASDLILEDRSKA